MDTARDLLTTITQQPGNTIQLTGSKSDLPQYCINSFPAALQVWAKELQSVHNIEAAYTLTTALVLAGTLIGNKYIAQIKSEHLAPPIFFAMLIGNSGAGKSPAIDYASKHIQDYCIRKYRDYQQTEKDHKEREAAAKAAGAELTEAPPIFTERYIFNNTTTEALYKHLENAFNAVSFIVDEYKDFHDNNINSRYGNGSDRGKVLSWIDGKPIFIDTKKDGTKLIERTNISIIGGTQPDRLPEVIGKTSDGLTERFLYAYNTRPYRAYSYETVNNAIIYEYNNTMQKLIEIDFSFDEYGKLSPRKVPFAESAFSIYVSWCEQLAERVREAETELSRTVYTKMQNFCPRIALVLQLLYYACNEGTDQHITDKAINGAIELTEYYIATSLKVHGEAMDSNPLNRLTTQQHKIYKDLPGEFTTAEGIEIASRYGMKPVTFKRFIARKELFTKPSHGHYEKLY